MSLVLNRPTPEGLELGAELARLVAAEITKVFDGEDPRCASCAFRPGTIPNGCGPTLMNALKCVMEVQPFYCHMGDRPVCAGWVALVHGTDGPRSVPWDYTPGADYAAPEDKV